MRRGSGIGNYEIPSMTSGGGHAAKKRNQRTLYPPCSRCLEEKGTSSILKMALIAVAGVLGYFIG